MKKYFWIAGQMDFGRLNRQTWTVFLCPLCPSFEALFFLCLSVNTFISTTKCFSFPFHSLPLLFLLMLYWMKECHRVWKHVLTKSPPSTDSIATSFFKSKPLSKNNYKSTHWNVNPKTWTKIVWNRRTAC